MNSIKDLGVPKFLQLGSVGFGIEEKLNNRARLLQVAQFCETGVSWNCCATPKTARRACFSVRLGVKT
jgi:hypothetical protein